VLVGTILLSGFWQAWNENAGSTQKEAAGKKMKPVAGLRKEK